MATRSDFLDADDRTLLSQCDVHTYRSSGPGGQHRNKVSSAVRLRHRPTGLTVHGDDTRSQHQNKRLAIQRLRMNLACKLRDPADPARPAVPRVIRECLFRPRGDCAASLRLEIGPRDRRFWPVTGFLLDLLAACQGRISAASGSLGVTSSNLTSVFQSHPVLLTAAQAIRKAAGLRPLA